jgi:hypothetical protein
MPRCQAPGEKLLVDMSEGIGGKVGGKFQMLVEVEGIPTKLLLDSGAEVSLIGYIFIRESPRRLDQS